VKYGIIENENGDGEMEFTEVIKFSYMMVRPCLDSLLTYFMTFLAPALSKPEVGSSKNSNCGFAASSTAIK
jgi:hypothetical protein